jgi:hypothetical protein
LLYPTQTRPVAIPKYTYGWYSASAGNNDMHGIISKVKL